MIGFLLLQQTFSLEVRTCNTTIFLAYMRSVIVSTVISAHASGKQGNFQTMSFLTILHHSLGHCRRLNWLKDCRRGMVFCWGLWEVRINK